MATAPAFPKKLFYRIQEVAEIIGVEAYVLRYWETKFPMLSPEKDGKDQRRYRQRDIEVLLRIRELLYDEKYTIAGAIDRLREELSSRKRGVAVTPEPVAVEEEPVAEATIEPVVTEAPLNESQMDRIRRVREELGLLRRELEEWRDELG